MGVRHRNDIECSRDPHQQIAYYNFNHTGEVDISASFNLGTLIISSYFAKGFTFIYLYDFVK